VEYYALNLESRFMDPTFIFIFQQSFQFRFWTGDHSVILDSDVWMHFQTDEPGDISSRVSHMIFFIFAALQGQKYALVMFAREYFDGCSCEAGGDLIVSTYYETSFFAFAVEGTHGRMVNDLFCEENDSV